jgi:sulfite exporter TauE/SafE
MIANLHCVGMCGPIALALPLKRDSKIEIINGILQYNLGRILTYSLLGYIIGFIGLSINLFGLIQGLSIATGIGIIIYAWRKYFISNVLYTKINFHFIQKFTSKNMGEIIRKNGSFKLLLFGMLNGLLPCGMVYTALFTSILAGSPRDSLFTMFFFGLGTLPGMILISLFATQITNKFRGRINKFLPYFLTFIGLIIVIRGLNLDIPYLSPKTTIDKKTQLIKMKTCHPSFSIK